MYDFSFCIRLYARLHNKKSTQEYIKVKAGKVKGLPEVSRAGQSRYAEDNRPSQQQGGLQLCCQELQYVNEQCQCEAVKEAFREAQKMQQQQQGQQGGSFGSKQIRQMMQKAQNLPNQCKLQTRQCQVGKISITTFTTITEDTTYSRRGSQQQCEHIRGRQFNQCQNFIQRQMGSYATLLMSVSRQGQQPQGLEQCCSELQNVEEECQCEAMQEVYRQAQRQQQQGSQQRGRRGGQPQTQDLQQIVQSLPNQCKLEVHQCRIPSTMF
ncbi:unnamed protein product [Lactuca virosa]|uniref:Bifunctional inhibitor/plant lipid transfer protein/seed storage helical domain-containing protein n=1 Tax=Lactuca virosa TaxID=75947 RepID=A0AAU9PKN8_9ASTR|nr:unnamed protein product [Lactuca virosa]